MKVLKFFKRLTDYFVVIPIWFYLGADCMADMVNTTVPRVWIIICIAVSLSSAIAWGCISGAIDAKENDEKQENK